MESGPATDTAGGHLREVALLFIKLGTIAFGGPAAHIAMMHDEVVHRRKWLSEEEFLDMLGATNLIPGPNSTEMAIHLGYRRAGWRGLIVGGAAFILPAFLIVLALAWAYVRYGDTPQATWLLYGIKPVIIAVVLQAIWKLRKAALKDPLTTTAAVGALALYILGINELALLFGLGAIVMLARRMGQRGGGARAAPVFLPPLLLAGGNGVVAASAGAGFVAAAGKNLLLMFLLFLKIGSVLYGSGYVLLAFLQGDFVDRLGWLTQDQLLEAVSIGQFTPGPVFTTATFIGYILGSWQGAILATIGIFLPGFVFVAILHRILPRLRASPWTGGFLDGVNASALGLMAAVTLELGIAAVIDVPTALLALASAFLLIRFGMNSAWLILGGALVGIVYAVATGEIAWPG